MGIYIKRGKIHKNKMLKCINEWAHMRIRVEFFLPNQVPDRIGRSGKCNSSSGRELGKITLPDNVPDRVLMSGKRFSSFLPLFLFGTRSWPYPIMYPIGYPCRVSTSLPSFLFFWLSSSLALSDHVPDRVSMSGKHFPPLVAFILGEL